VTRLLSIPVLLVACSLVPAQDAKNAAAKADKTPAAKKFEELGRKMSERMAELRGLERDKAQEAATAAQKARAEDLQGFLTEFPASPEATKATLEIATLAIRMPDLKQAGVAALDKLDFKSAETASVVQAAGLAGKLGAEQTKSKAIAAAKAKLATADVKTLLATAESAGMYGLTEQMDDWLAQADRAAKGDEDKAKILMAKAKVARRSRDEAKAKDLYAEVAKTYPKTTAGRIAQGKLLAKDLKEGSELIPFTGKDLAGEEVGPKTYEGKVLLIDFWATWCGPCMQEMPNVVKTYEAYHDKGFDVLGISLDREGDRKKLEECLEKNHMPWRQIYDGGYWDAEVAQMYDVNSIPFTLLVGRDGKIIGKGLRGEKLEAAVKTAIGD